MRITGGKAARRILKVPKGLDVRPTPDLVKQAVFNSLGARVAGARVLELFAGTGALSLECLSRGAAHATFFDSDRSALQRLKKNIAALKVENRATIIPGDLFKFFSTNTPTEKANLIFLDPPYRFLKEDPQQLRNLANALASDYLTSDGLLIFRHDVQDALELPRLKLIDRREYGGMVLEFLQCNGSCTEQ